MQPKVQNQNFKIAAYIRVSTEEQAENPEGSIRNQEERIKDAILYRNRNGNYGELVHTFTDPGISAKDMKRPQLQTLLKAIRSREINLVIVTELSRLSRNTRDFIQIWDLMREVGCRFSSLREDFDTTNAAGELVLFQLMNLAQFERRQTSERVEANIAARSKRGLYNGGTVPVGFKIIPDKPGFLEVDPEMAEVVKEAFAAFLREGSLAPAAKWLNNNGYRLRCDLEGGGRLKRVGHFTTDNLQSMLRKKAYIGIKEFKVKNEVFEAKAVWPAIVDEMTFARVGKILSENRQRLKPHKVGKLPYLLSSLTKCEKCGDVMVGKSATGNGGKVGYYEHGWATKRDSTLTKKIFKCDPHRVPAKKIEPLVWQKFLKFINEPEFVKDILQKIREFHEANPTRKEQERLKAKLFGINSQLDGLAERLSELPKGVSAAPIYKQMQKLEELAGQYKVELEKLKSSNEGFISKAIDFDNFQEFAQKYKKLTFDELSVDQKKQLLKRFIHKIEIGVDQVKIHFIVDEEHFSRIYKDDLAEKRQSNTLAADPAAASGQESNFFRICGSNTLTNGAPART